MPVDLVVVGGSFAGLACAEAAALSGLEVVVLDRKTEAGADCHTTGLVVQEVMNEWALPPSLVKRIAAVKLYGPSLGAIELRSRGYAFWATDTPGLLRWFAGRAERAGARLLWHRPVAQLRRRGDRFDLGEGLSSRFVVGADGPNSRVARELSLGRNRHWLVGCEEERVGVTGLGDEQLHCFIDSELAPGYLGWAVPGLGVTQLGLAARAPHRPELEALRERVAAVCDLSGSTVVGRRGGLIPCGGAVRPAAAPGALLVGDAAGLVSPLTAGGIHLALHFGREAGRAVAAELHDGVPATVRLARRYPRPAVKRMLRRLCDTRPANRLLDLTLDQLLFRLVARLVFFHHRGLLSPRAWREVWEETREASRLGLIG